MTQRLICSFIGRRTVGGWMGGVTSFSFRSGAPGGTRGAASPGLRRACGASWLGPCSAPSRQRREWGNPGSTAPVTARPLHPRAWPAARTAYRWVKLGVFVRFCEEHFRSGDLHLGQFRHLKREKRGWRDGRRGGQLERGWRKPLVLVYVGQLLLSSVSSLLPSGGKKKTPTINWGSIKVHHRHGYASATSFLTFFFSSRSFINVSLSTSLTTVGRPATQPSPVMPSSHPDLGKPTGCVTFVVLQPDAQLRQGVVTQHVAQLQQRRH